MEDRRIKTIIFDCFGVLYDDTFDAFFLRYFGDDAEKLAAAKQADVLANKGIITHAEMIEEFSRLGNVSVEQLKQELDKGTVNTELFDLIKNLKRDYRIGFLSNANDNYLNTLFSPEQVALFDAVSISCESGFTKPHPGAYADIVEKLDLRFDESIFIDDREDYCEGARSVGMQAIRYKDVNSLKSELNELGINL